MAGGDWGGTRIGGCELQEKIADEEDFVTYRAIQLESLVERHVNVYHAHNEAFKSDFLRNANLLCALNHPNLWRVRDCIVEKDTLFLFCDAWQGETLETRMLRENSIAVWDAIEMIRQVASGLQAAHESGVVHRAVHPRHIAIQNSNSVCVFNFAPANNAAGIPCAARQDYLSPEARAKGISDARSDIYSLAVTFYEIITGSLPFLKEGTTVMPPSRHFPYGKFPVEMDRLLQKSMAQNPEERPATMQQFLSELDSIVNSLRRSRLEITVVSPWGRWQPGYVFADRYLIEKKVGEGGMGIVYKAHDRTLNSEVALKIMAPSLADHPRRVERFKREVILARKVAHPSVCRIYDIGQNKGMHYVSMEYLNGRTLAEVLEDGPIPLEKGIFLATEILLALRAAHHAGVIHRDLKPQNIMIDQEGKPHIMDFGISVPLDYTPMTTTGALVGTPLYMAPELLQNQKADQRSDLYSAGIVLHEIFTGRKPFDVENRVAALLAQVKFTPARLKTLTGELEAIILKALKKNPSERYQTVDEILRDFHNLNRIGDRKNKLIAAAMIVAIALVAVISIRSLTRKQILTVPANATSVVSPHPDIEKLPVRITSLPWARIRVESVSGEPVPRISEQQKQTPTVLYLGEGEYFIELSGTNGQQDVKKIRVANGSVNSFQFTLPSYDINRIVEAAEKDFE